MLTKRTNIMFDADLWNLLVAVARKEKSSVGGVVRRAVNKVYAEGNLIEQKRLAFETIKKFRVKQRGELDYKTLINEGRKH